MPDTPTTAFETVTPTEAEAKLARDSRRLLAARLGSPGEVRIQVLDNGNPGEAVAVPASVLRLLLSALEELADGHSVALVPVHAELSPQQAADLLNVSRPFLVRLLDEGKIPSRQAGPQRRVRFDDLMEYKKRTDAARLQALEELAAQAQELGMGY